MADLDGALVANETTWILDVKVSNNGEGADYRTGPFLHMHSCRIPRNIKAK